MLEPSIGFDEFLEAEGLNYGMYYGMRDRGEAPRSYKVGRTRRFLLSDIAAWRAEMMKREPEITSRQRKRVAA